MQDVLQDVFHDSSYDGSFFVWNFFVAISVRYQECIAYRRYKIYRFKESCIVKSQGSSIEKNWEHSTNIAIPCYNRTYHFY